MKQLLLAMMLATTVSTTAFAQNKVKNIYASSPKLDIELLQNGDQNVQLNRYFYAGYNTLCLPMSLSAEQLGDIKVERFLYIQQEGAVLNLYFLECTEDGIQAGMPYLIYSPKNQYLRIKNSDAITIDNDLTAIHMTDNNGNLVTFGSSWDTIGKAGRYGIPAQQNVTPLEAVLIQTTADQKFLPTRCGFTWNQQSATAKELRIVHLSPSEVTGINSVSIKNADNNNIYNLKGQKVTNTTRGVFIQNGKKTVVK